MNTTVINQPFEFYGSHYEFIAAIAHKKYQAIQQAVTSTYRDALAVSGILIKFKQEQIDAFLHELEKQKLIISSKQPVVHAKWHFQDDFETTISDKIDHLYIDKCTKTGSERVTITAGSESNALYPTTRLLLTTTHLTETPEYRKVKDIIVTGTTTKDLKLQKSIKIPGLLITQYNHALEKHSHNIEELLRQYTEIDVSERAIQQQIRLQWAEWVLTSQNADQLKEMEKVFDIKLINP